MSVNCTDVYYIHIGNSLSSTGVFSGVLLIPIPFQNVFDPHFSLKLDILQKFLD